jgi:hypothetical protein
MNFEFDSGCGFEQDFTFMDDEDFGLAKSFTTAPIGIIMPSIDLKQAEVPNPEKECEEQVLNNSEIRADGFCFKLHPTEDQV